MAASMFMNSNSLPIALMQSLVVTVPGLQWDNDDTESAMLGRALTYLVLYSTLGMVVSVNLLLKYPGSNTHRRFSFDGVTECICCPKQTQRPK